jgi:hypothetical protein
MLEEDFRRIFLTFLKPIINGVGHVYIEPHTRDHTRSDAIIDYLGARDIVELKIWHGIKHLEDAEIQLLGHLDEFSLYTGYVLAFSKLLSKDVRMSSEKMINGKRIITTVV